MSKVNLTKQAAAMRFDVYEDDKLYIEGASFYDVLDEYSSEAEIFEDDSFKDLRAGELDLFFTLSVGEGADLISGIGVPTVSIRRVS